MLQCLQDGGDVAGIRRAAYRVLGEQVQDEAVERRGASGRIVRRDAGSALRCWSITDSGSPSAKGGLPASSAYSTQPSEYRSLRSSTCFPSHCSGDMYEGVPMAWPVSVRPTVASTARAIPKSQSFSWPLLRRNKLAGLRSR